MKYRVYYSNGKISEEENPPARDVQAILQKNEEGEWIIRSGGDYYVLRNGVWIEVDIFGLFDYLMDSGLVLFGRTLSNTEFSEIMKKALKDREVLYD